MGPGTIIFDFDGTLCNSLPELYQIVNRLATEYGYLEVTPEMVPRLRESSVLESVQILKVPVYRIPALIKRCRNELRAQVENLSSFEGLGDELRKLRSRGMTLGIISSNSEENIRAFLNKQNWDCFSFIYSGSSLFGKGRLLKHCLEEKALDRLSTLYVGDEIRDIEAARRAQIKSIGVAWGFQTASRIKNAKPDTVIERPTELLEACLKLVSAQ